MFVNAIHPGLHIVKRLLIRQVKSYYHPVGLPVELVRDRPETFLPCCVPDLDIKFLIALSVLAWYVIEAYS